ncbi:hypothetical protein D9M73_203180 [compost metagenome]
MRDLQALQVLGRIVGNLLVTLDHVVEQEVVGENGGEQLSVVIPVKHRDRLTIQQDVTTVRRIQAKQQLDQRGLATTVLADDEHDVALVDREVHRAQAKRRAALDSRKCVLHIAQFQAVDGLARCALAVEQQVRFGRGKLL